MPLDDHVLIDLGIGMGDLTLDELALAFRAFAEGQVLLAGRKGVTICVTRIASCDRVGRMFANKFSNRTRKARKVAGTYPAIEIAASLSHPQGEY